MTEESEVSPSAEDASRESVPSQAPPAPPKTLPGGDGANGHPQGDPPPEWRAVVGALIGVGVLVFLGVIYFRPPTVQQQPVVTIFCAFGVALAFGFIGGSVAVKFSIPFFRSNPMAGSATGAIAGFVVTIVLLRWLFAAQSAPTADDPWPPKPFSLRIVPMAPEAQKPGSIIFLEGTERRESFALQRELGYYNVRDVTLPKPEKPYRASLRPEPPDSFASDKQATIPTLRRTDLCVVPNAAKVTDPRQFFASLRWNVESSLTEVVADDPKWLLPCPSLGAFPAFLVRSAYAAGPAEAKHWVAASLATLERRHTDPADDPPYMRFVVRGDVQDPQLQRRYVLTIAVNTVPVFIDGWEPPEVPNAIPEDGHFAYDFALQNLGLSGGDRGLETLSLRFQWRSDTGPVGDPDQTDLPFVAFRDVAQTVAEFRRARVTVSAEYVPSLTHDRYSIFLASTTDLDAARTLKQRVGTSHVSLDGTKVVGVLRPPLTPWRLQQYANANYAVLLGVERPTGQVAFSFDAEEADRLCRNVYKSLGDFHGSVSDTVFRFEWPPPSGRPAKEISRAYRLCKQL